MLRVEGDAVGPKAADAALARMTKAHDAGYGAQQMGWAQALCNLNSFSKCAGTVSQPQAVNCCVFRKDCFGLMCIRTPYFRHCPQSEA